MNFDMKKPCPKCPFRIDVDPFLRPGRVEQILHDMIVRQHSFSCHTTVEYGHDDGEGRTTEKSQHCAGAMILLEKIECPNQAMRLAQRMKWYDPEQLDMAAPVYGSEEDMIEAYRRANA